MKKVFSAISHGHWRNSIHRDSKPENIVFESQEPDAPLKVINFGLTTSIQYALGTPYYVSPEALAGEPSRKSDIWSCGVILYIMLCGYPPFNGEDDQEIYQAIKEGKLSFDPEDWGGISDSAKQFITKLLEKNPNLRPSAKDALEDPWIQSFADQTQINLIKSKSLSHLKEFHNQSRFHQMITSFIVTQVMGPKEKEKIRDAFEALDTDKNGVLTQDEIINNIDKFSVNNQYMSIAEAEELFDGKIELTELITALVQRQESISKDQIEQAFKIFDEDDNGFLTRSELENALGKMALPDSEWKNILSEADTDGDGKISHSEFVALMMKKKSFISKSPD